MNTQMVKQALRNGPYAWPGGYPQYFLTSSGDTLSFTAVRAEYQQVARAMRHPGTDPWWEVEAVRVNWEEPDMHCAHTGERIPSAYGED